MSTEKMMPTVDVCVLREVGGGDMLRHPRAHCSLVNAQHYLLAKQTQLHTHHGCGDVEITIYQLLPPVRPSIVNLPTKAA